MVHQLVLAQADRKAFICMCRSLPRARKERIYSLSRYKPLWFCKIFPSGYKLQSLHLQTHLSQECPLHLFLPLLSFLVLCQVILPFVFILPLGGFHLVSPAFLCGVLELLLGLFALLIECSVQIIIYLLFFHIIFSSFV